MNVLSVLMTKDNRAQRLNEAQKIHLKAYRGIPYREAPRPSHVDSELTYRGQQHHTSR